MRSRRYGFSLRRWADGQVMTFCLKEQRNPSIRKLNRGLYAHIEKTK